MKTPFHTPFPFKWLVSSAAAAALLLSSPALQAESTYGYSATGAAGVRATAKVKITVEVPTLLLLRVGGDSTTVDTVTLTMAPNPGIPGGVLAAALVGGNSQASAWDGTASTMGMTASPVNITASAWTNAAGGGSLNGAVTTPFDSATSGLAAADIEVASSGTLIHPAANTGTFTATAFARNTLATSTWTYSLSTAGLTSAKPGSHTQTVTYTATAL